jgi:hypothetical protein
MYNFSRPDLLYDPMDRAYTAECEFQKRMREMMEKAQEQQKYQEQQKNKKK